MTNWKWSASLLCVAAAPVLAQSSVTLYGRVDTSIELMNFGPSHAVRMGSGDIFAMQFGLKGAEDLGGGYRAIFKLENGFNSATGALGNNGALFGREAWVGLTGPFGIMQAGVNYTVLPAFIYVRHRGGPDVATAVTTAYSNPHNGLFELDATVPVGRALVLPSYGHYRKVAHSEGNADSFGVRVDYPLSQRAVRTAS
ncbi:hypothetical protein CIC12_15910 [Burkholderia sp. SG-MS1]|uniref:porin n=1 Tax=Paraburkholderia sp. SG-MS1 TaxID=2023741 RepID=UPI00144510B2|nr:porin [Paraburkholderia sp. SG-MS1]NKJ48197.1 hypothetical protein [Paraburkholderia sp. SG-MS1]